jgi:GDPmannose 4,6-dehydratase
MAHALTVNYRESHGLFCVSGLTFNHESPLRGRDFVTRKISLGLAAVKHGARDGLLLGNLDARRDWGFAGDYVDGIWRMLQHAEPDDYVLATGKTTTVRTFVELVSAYHGFDLHWTGSGAEETGIDGRSGRPIVRIDPQLYRPADDALLVGSPQRALSRLGWRHTVEVPALAAMMAEADDRAHRDGSSPW